MWISGLANPRGSVVILAIAVAALLAGVACGGGGGDTRTPLPSGRTLAPTAAGDKQISKLAARFLAGVDGKYVYRYTGPIGQVTEGKLTLVRLGVNDRWDWTSNQFDFDATTVTIMGEQKNYLCTVAQSLNSCREAGVAELDGVRFISSPIFNGLADLVTEPDKYEVDDLPDETFAGLTGKCYHASSKTRIGEGPPSSEEIKACYTDQGVVIYFQRTTKPDSSAIEPSTFTIELQERTEATLKDFEPTGRVQ
ncbi:MAG TPA: hypothetical protein VLS25_00910 [Dehalococcoidia bacterium]|nr:hypothetical protein [Dehalococcoidia bacterium]